MQRIKELREERGLSQKELGELLNVGQNTVSRYETGDNEPDVQTIKKLCKIFDVTAGYLLELEEFQ